MTDLCASADHVLCTLHHVSWWLNMSNSPSMSSFWETTQKIWFTAHRLLGLPRSLQKCVHTFSHTHTEFWLSMSEKLFCSGGISGSKLTHSCHESIPSSSSRFLEKNPAVISIIALWVCIIPHAQRRCPRKGDF